MRIGWGLLMFVSVPATIAFAIFPGIFVLQVGF
jgi:hypothetical protein